MKTTYILIDYESVQPENVAILNGHPFKLFVFVGAKQPKVPVDFAKTLQPIGDRAEYIKISGSGRNALDFHIAYYIGRLAAQDASLRFHIISNDAGYDPLIEHLKERAISVERYKDLAEIPLPKTAKAAKPIRSAKTVKPAKQTKTAKPETPKETGSLEEMIKIIVKNFVARGQSRPRKVKTLASTINALFPNKLNKGESRLLIDELCMRKMVLIDNDNVSYGPPIKQP